MHPSLFRRRLLLGPGILNDADLAADGTLEPLDHEQIPCEHYSSADRDESFDKHTNDTGADEEFQFELAADSRVDDKSLTLDDAADGTTGYVPHDTNDSRSYFNEQGPFGLVASDVFNASNLGPFDNEVVKKIPDMLTDAMSDGAALKTVVLGDAMNDLVWSVLDDALTGGTASGGRMLDYDMEDMMWSKLDDAICGQASSDRTDLAAALDDVFTSLMHQAFFGSVASTAVASLTKSADVSEVVVQSYVRAVSGLYEQFKQVRIRTAAKDALNKELPAELAHDSVADPAIGSTPPDGDHTAFYEEFPFHFALGDVIDEISFGPFDLVPAEEEVDNDETPSFLYDADDSAFDEANPFDTIHNGIVDGIRLGSFGPVIPVYVVADKMTILHDAMSGGAISNAVDDLVRSVLESAFTTEGASTDLALDDTMDCMLWAKLHDAVCGRPISDPTSDTDSLDDMLTYLLHRALLGPAASKAVASFIMSADDIELTVLAYVRAVSEFYDKLKQVRCRLSNNNRLNSHNSCHSQTSVSPYLFQKYRLDLVRYTRVRRILKTIAVVCLMTSMSIRPCTTEAKKMESVAATLIYLAALLPSLFGCYVFHPFLKQMFVSI